MPQAVKNIYHLAVAVFATLFFRYPGKNLIVIGVTGTDGKTTTVHLIYKILKNAGKKVSMISSVGAKIGGKDYDLPFHVTTPNSCQLQKFLRLAIDQGEKFLVLEVTSHGLDQNRVWGIPFKIGVLTNVSHEHLDYHRTYEDYLATKTKLFKGVGWGILNREDESYNYFKFKISNLKFTKILTYGLKMGDITPANFSFQTPLPGEYNQYNALAAIATAKTLGISDLKIRQAVADFSGVLGRFEFVETEKEFAVVVDFAHTPNALENVLSTISRGVPRVLNAGTGLVAGKGPPRLKPQVSRRLIHVFGCAGLRDKLKRPKMGEISAKYAQVIVLTEEDYRTEDVNEIIEEIAQGIPVKKKIFKIPDRQEAINFAIKIAKKRDLVILTGKGHEKSLCRGKIEYPWDEREAVKIALSNL
ncbi:MAG: Uncharacterized protein LiPW16_211 [Microgenomates group bacterium LiPW_16]|nr:MAG: Uncharacterized protein LiPW16_211 [Microgenomates group bacterium LiPW_16]